MASVQLAKENGLCENTKSAYRSSIKRWEEFAASHNFDPKALNGETIKNLIMYIETRSLNFSGSTLVNDNSALKDYFRNTLKQGDEKFVRSESGVYQGNPMMEREVKETLREKISVKRGERKGREHARVMSYEDLSTLLALLDKETCSITGIARVWAKCILTLGFFCLFRSEELALFRVNDFHWHERTPEGIPFIRIVVRQRKNNLADDEPQQLRVFNIQDDHEKKICPFRPLNDFFTQYKTILGDLIEDNPLMFPKVILKTGKISLCQPINHRTITELIKRICQDTDQSDSIGTYKYNTHFMRRGGAQYRLLYAPIWKMRFDQLKQWGGWSINEADETILKYILPDNNAYKRCISDFFDPHRSH